NPDLQAQVAALNEDLANIAATLATIGNTSASVASSNASSTFEYAKARGEDSLDAIRSHSNAIEYQLTETVRENPLTTVAVAAGVGFLLAL
ncbi:DUF883 family protein, partial [Aestuariibaculum lutulentum]